MTPEEIAMEVEVLQSSPLRERIAGAACRIAADGTAGALGSLARQLRSREFLGRLDAIDDPREAVNNIRRIFGEFERNPSETSARVCVILGNDPEFTSLPVRLNFLLPALAAVRPMSDAAAAIFRRTNAEGYYALNAPLLTRNGSAAALGVFEELISSERIDDADKVYLLHHSIVPVRTGLPILELCVRLVNGPLSGLTAAVVESVFDYQERPWYGNALRPPRQPSWDAASVEALHYARRWANELLAGGTLPANLSDAVRNSETLIARAIARYPG
ncbi:MAG: hypothetical protein FJW30_17060 [Acidobacteria bacterium]|nr:hypothetical protein [Acidobacteriota bacterium]